MFKCQIHHLERSVFFVAWQMQCQCQLNNTRTITFHLFVAGSLRTLSWARHSQRCLGRWCFHTFVPERLLRIAVRWESGMVPWVCACWLTTVSRRARQRRWLPLTYHALTCTLPLNLAEVTWCKHCTHRLNTLTRLLTSLLGLNLWANHSLTEYLPFLLSFLGRKHRNTRPQAWAGNLANKIRLLERVRSELGDRVSFVPVKVTAVVSPRMLEEV